MRESPALKPAIINAKEQGSFVMTMRKLQRRRSAFRELLQSLDTGRFGGEAPLRSVGWLKQPRLRLDQGHRSIPSQLYQGESR